MDPSRSRKPSVDQDSMMSGSGESLSSSAEMDVVHSDSSSRVDISSAACASREGDTSSVDTPAVKAADPSHGPSVANIKVGPFRTCAK